MTLRCNTIGLEVIHSPNPVKAQEGGASGYKFTWTYTTTVRANNDTVVIINFGSFFWNGNKWVLDNFTGKPFSAKDFTDWYSCPHATLVIGQECSDTANWTGGNSLNDGESKWVYVSINSKGEYMKGESIIKTSGEIIK
jgi:hypothetical protein